MIQWLIIIALLLIAAALAYVLERKFDEAGRLKRERDHLTAKLEKDQREAHAMGQMMETLREKRMRAGNAFQGLERELAAERVKRAVAWPKPERRMTEREVLGQFDVEMGDPFWTAIHQELDDAIGDQLDLVTQAPAASLTAEQRVHIAGMAEVLRTFQRRLLDRQAAATRAEADEDDAKAA